MMNPTTFFLPRHRLHLPTLPRSTRSYNKVPTPPNRLPGPSRTAIGILKRTNTLRNGHWIPPGPLFPIAISQCGPRRRYSPTLTDARPQDLFTLHPYPPRIIHNNDPTQILLLAHGVPGKGKRRRDPRESGGIGIFFSANENVSRKLLVHPSMVDRITPTGDPVSHTHHSAQLQAAVTGLGLRDWKSEGWKRIVVATCWAWIVDGVSGKAVEWDERGWKNGNGVTVRYREIWGELLSLLETLGGQGIDVKFWDIMKADNPAVDLALRGRGDDAEPAQKLWMDHKRGSYSYIKAKIEKSKQKRRLGVATQK